MDGKLLVLGGPNSVTSEYELDDLSDGLTNSPDFFRSSIPGVPPGELICDVDC